MSCGLETAPVALGRHSGDRAVHYGSLAPVITFMINGLFDPCVPPGGFAPPLTQLGNVLKGKRQRELFCSVL